MITPNTSGKSLVPLKRVPKVCIVDPQPRDYAALVGDANLGPFRIELLNRGDQALHAARVDVVDVWVINVDLPDMSGLDLCQMLRDHSPRELIYLVTDAYRAEDERAAWTRGATMFRPKPAQAAWFEQIEQSTTR